MALFGLFSKEKKASLDKGLEKTKENFFSKISKAVAGKSKVDEAVLDELEEVLITSDVGVDTTIKIIERLEKRVARDKYVGTEELHGLLKDEIAQLLADNNTPDPKEFTPPASGFPYYKGWPKQSKLAFHDRERTKLKEVIPIEHGEKEGYYYHFHENGLIAAMGEYKFDAKVGIWNEFYNKRRRRKRQVKYREDPFDKESRPYILKEWNENGKLIYDRKNYF